MLAVGDLVSVVAPADDDFWDIYRDSYITTLNFEHKLVALYPYQWWALSPGIKTSSGVILLFRESWLRRANTNSHTSKNCTCPLQKLMSLGCKCGGQ